MNGLFTDEYDINQARLNKARERYPDMNITMRVDTFDNRIILLEIRHNDPKFDYVYKQMLDYDVNDDRIDMAIGYGVERVRMHMGVKNVIDPVYNFNKTDDKSYVRYDDVMNIITDPDKTITDIIDEVAHLHRVTIRYIMDGTNNVAVVDVRN